MYFLYSLLTITAILIGDISAKGDEDFSLQFADFFAAVRFQRIEKIEEFLQHPELKSFINLTNRDKKSALHEALEINDHIAELLLQKGADYKRNYPRGGDTCLHVAVEMDRKKSVRYMMSRDVSVIDVNDDGNAAVHLAACQDKEMVDMLLAKSKHLLRLQNKRGMTPLIMALNKPGVDLDVVKALLQNSDLKARDERCNSALHYAAHNGDEKVVEALLKADESLAYARNDVGWTPLLRALQPWDFKIGYSRRPPRMGVVKALIYACNGVPRPVSEKDVGANIDAMGTEGVVSALHVVVAAKDLEMTQFLLSKKVNLNAPNAENETPITWMLKDSNRFHMGIFKALINAKANLYIPDKEGIYAFKYAENMSRTNAELKEEIDKLEETTKFVHYNFLGL